MLASLSAKKNYQIQSARNRVKKIVHGQYFNLSTGFIYPFWLQMIAIIAGKWRHHLQNPPIIWSKSVISTSSDIQNHDFDDDFVDDDFDLSKNHHQKSSSKKSSSKSSSKKSSPKSSSKSWFWISDDIDITDLDQISMDFGDDVTLLHRRLLSFVIKIFIWNRYSSESSTHVQFLSRVSSRSVRVVFFICAQRGKQIAVTRLKKVVHP